MIKIPLLFVLMVALVACKSKKESLKKDFIIAHGQMPNIAKDNKGGLHLVYGSGDSIMYSFLQDRDTSFSAPALVAVLPKLAASHTRGPQIAYSSNGLTITACDADGNIFSYNKAGSASWVSTGRVNDMDTVAKENLMSLAGDGDYNYAVWLDLRGNRKNKIFGARSGDGGKTWSKNTMIYTSPDTTVCECCKPTVVVKGSNVYVLFRNWLNGNRNMYLIKSQDAGTNFGKAEKLGLGDWKLNGCPMDGGSISIGDNNVIKTVWKREGKIYSSVPGRQEQEIGEGRGCTLDIVGEGTVYAWVKDGVITVTSPGGQRLALGKGSQPVLKALNESTAVCVWENEKQIYAAIFKI